MSYAIVKFLDDGDSPGVVCVDWIMADGETCYYPNVKTDEARDRFLRKQVSASPDWPIRRIKILHKYGSFNDARRHLRRAEETSNLDSEEDDDYPRKRHCFQNFEDTEDQDASFSKRDERDPLPRPPSVTPTPVSPSPEEFQCESLSPVPSTSGYSPTAVIRISPPVPMPRTSMLPPVKSEFCQDCCRRYAAQAGQLTVWMAEVMKRLDSIERNILNRQPPHEQESSDGEEIIGLLPICDDGTFILLNAKISESSDFRQSLTKILTSVGGREIRTLIFNMLKRLMDDAVAELYSLSGKTTSSKILPKKVFSKTEIYKLIFSSCQKVFPEATELQMKEAIGDWLNQAKHRRSRRLNSPKCQEKNRDPSALEFDKP